MVFLILTHYKSGSLLTHGIATMDVAGSDLTQCFINVFNERGYSFNKSGTMDKIGKDIKEKLGYVAQDFEAEMRKIETLSKNYKLPDGKVITIGSEAFCCPEILFKPSLIGNESDGIDKLIHNSIMKCNKNIQYLLYNNIVFMWWYKHVEWISREIK